ncbi:hypothetical protein C8R46DRAFT_1184495 [Mycena filopes]|nr:hypothetical protein C8R46DRAFT_1184495 [Mycena filopes]
MTSTTIDPPPPVHSRLDIRAAAALLATIVSAELDDPKNPLEPFYTDVEACRRLLCRSTSLEDLLQDAHEKDDYAAIRVHPRIQLAETRDIITEYLDEIRPDFETFVLRENLFDVWEPDPGMEGLEPNTLAHLESLQIPQVDKTPAVLIDRWGSFQDDHKLSNRVDHIFQKGATNILMNAAATGKTRLAFEGLCRHWGFYFPMNMDGNHLGSHDQYHHEYMSADITKEEHKRRWLLFQLTDFARTVFERILYLCQCGEPDLSLSFSHLFGPASPNRLVPTPAKIEERIGVLFAKLRMIHGPEFHLFYVVDEANKFARLHTEAFQYQGKSYPVLQEIIHSWAAKSNPNEASFVVLGTDIPRDSFATLRNLNKTFNQIEISDPRYNK